MDVPADDAIEAAVPCQLRCGLLVAVHVLHGVADARLQVAGQRPVRLAEAVADGVDAPVEPQRDVVEVRAHRRQQAVAAYGGIELIAVRDQQPQALRRHMQRLALQAQPAELRATELAQFGVVIARDADHLHALAHPFVEQPQHAPVIHRPVQAAARRPQVDDVADQVEPVGLHGLEEIEQQVGAAVGGAEMDVGEKDAADVSLEAGIRWRLGRQRRFPVFRLGPSVPPGCDAAMSPA